ncbi:hypothetical protein CW751_08680 [Brumimicrobium salinarum]|uniref:Uncharacterized protein n=2 Tax=Brumimicrobium salinarum TaxID=2058658 RepID=A0A2I0R2M5_9FLAO|nr:hypothetical protein CW751_08680 [Brumimicrobium salinarum]
MGCISNSSLRKNFPFHILNGNSAKVWILSKSNDVNEYAVPKMRNYRRTFTFFVNKSFREQELIHLGSDNGRIGRYKIIGNGLDDFVLELNYKDGERSYFKIIRIKNNFLKLQNYHKKEIEWQFKTLNPPLK